MSFAAKFAATEGRAYAMNVLRGEAPLDGQTAAKTAANHAVGLGKQTAKGYLHVWENVPRLIFRALQFLFAIIIVAMYGHRVDANHKSGTVVSSEWLYGLGVAILSALTAALFGLVAPCGALLDRLKTHRMFAWDLALSIAWLVVFGVFAGIFLHRSDKDPFEGASTTAMKGAVWLDLVNALFWLVSGVLGFIKTCVSKRVDSMGEKGVSKLFGMRTRPAAAMPAHHEGFNPV